MIECEGLVFKYKVDLPLDGTKSFSFELNAALRKRVNVLIEKASSGCQKDERSKQDGREDLT